MIGPVLLVGMALARLLVTEAGAGAAGVLDGQFECEWERAGELTRPSRVPRTSAA